MRMILVCHARLTASRVTVCFLRLESGHMLFWVSVRAPSVPMAMPETHKLSTQAVLDILSGTVDGGADT